jgi:virulence factor Mce-like protein
VITRRIWINLAVFAMAAAALIAYGFVDLLGNPLASITTVSAVLPTAAGLAPNFTVTYEGVDVGSVAGVSLVPGGARVTMTLEPGTHVPSDVAARIDIANALGQQEVDLVPDPPGSGPAPPDPPLRNGAVIAAAPDSTPADVGTVVEEATRLLQSIPAGDLNTVLQQLALALQNNGQNLRTIASASDTFSQEFLAYEQQFQALLENAPPVLDVITANAGSLRQGLADTAVLVQTLASKSPDLVKLLQQGGSAAADLNALVTENEPNLGCLVHDLSDVTANLAEPANLSDLSTTLATNEEFFGAVAAIAPSGPAKALTSGDTDHTQEWLRTRLLLPPELQQGDTYTTSHGLPAVMPGAACETEFGNGVGAALQPGFQPTGPGAHVVQPTAAEAQVRGGGTTPAAADSAARLPAGSGGGDVPAMTAVAALFVVGWMLTLGRRRPKRSARPLPAEAPAVGRGGPTGRNR